jgi:hypothetical protein
MRYKVAQSHPKTGAFALLGSAYIQVMPNTTKAEN